MAHTVNLKRLDNLEFDIVGTILGIVGTVGPAVLKMIFPGAKQAEDVSARWAYLTEAERRKSIEAMVKLQQQKNVPTIWMITGVVIAILGTIFILKRK
jgi:hypothetical protein